MAGVSNRQLNISLAGQIALNLDKQDEKGQDGRITKNVWENFWSKTGSNFKGKNENIGEDGLSVREAMGLIMTRIYNESKSTGQSVEEIAENLFNESGGEKIDADSVKFTDEEPAPAKGADPTEEPAPIKGADPTDETYPVEDIKESEKTSPAQKTQRPANTPALPETPPDFINKIPRRGKDYSKYNILSDYRQKVNDIYANRKQAKQNLQGIQDYLSEKSKYVDSSDTYKLNKDNAAYTINYLFSDGIYNKYKDSRRMKNIICGCVAELVKKAEELGINYDKSKLHGSNFTNSETWKTNGIVEEMLRVANAIVSHDNTAVNDFNALKAMQTPNKQNAGKTITDKATGNKYHYDENGYIKWTSEKGNEKFRRYSDGTYSMEDNQGGWILFDKNGKVISYMEQIKINGKLTNVWRNNNGMISSALYDVGTGSKKQISLAYDENGNCYMYVKESYEGKPYISEYRTPDGTLLYYSEYADKVFTYKDPQGNILKYCKDVNDDPGSLEGKWIYYNKDGKEISKEEYDNIYPYGE